MTAALLERPLVNGEEVFVTANHEVTNAELGRRLDSFAKEVHADLGELIRRLDAYVLREVYAADQRRREDQITALTVQLETERTQRLQELERLRTNVRWWWTAVVVPIGALVVNVWMQGGGG